MLADCLQLSAIDVASWVHFSVFATKCSLSPKRKHTTPHKNSNTHCNITKNNILAISPGESPLDNHLSLPCQLLIPLVVVSCAAVITHARARNPTAHPNQHQLLLLTYL